jgi:hypothetical protein
MEDTISPKYQMKLVADIEAVLWSLFPTSKYRNVRFYIDKWHQVNNEWNNFSENFTIYVDNSENIDLTKTLNNIDGETLLKIAIDLGVETPDFIPSIPVFRNEIKAEYKTASSTFEKAFKQIETHPDIAVGLANSALESIIKEILKDERINSKIKGTETLYALVSEILKVFQLFPNSDMPTEIKTISSSLLAANQSIEKLRSEKTNVHGKTEDEYVIEDPLYTYFIINSVATIGLFINSYYKVKFPKPVIEEQTNVMDDLPF